MDFGQPQTLVQTSANVESVRAICHCLNVTESEIRQVIAEHQPQSVRGVSQICGAGAGCMSCHRHIRRMLGERAQSRRHPFDEVSQAEQICATRFSADPAQVIA